MDSIKIYRRIINSKKRDRKRINLLKKAAKLYHKTGVGIFLGIKDGNNSSGYSSQYDSSRISQLTYSYENEILISFSIVIQQNSEIIDIDYESHIKDIRQKIINDQIINYGWLPAMLKYYFSAILK